MFYFAGRPVAALDKVTEDPPILEATTSTWQYLTVDHLGTPILVTDSSGAQVWQGGFEPFGADYSSASTILRFPGQWSDATWSGNGDVGLYYNVHRWYDTEAGRYGQTDPIDLGYLGNLGRSRELPVDALDAYYLSMLRMGNPEHEQPYLYAIHNPLLYSDPVGLFGAGALATVGGGCMAVDGQFPIGDIVGVSLIIVAGAWALSDIITDWWGNWKACDECERDLPSDDYCKKMKRLCVAKCKEETIPTGNLSFLVALAS